MIALVETSVLPHLQIGQTQPDLMLLVVSSWSLRRGVEEGAVWAFVGGMFLDLFSAGPFTSMTLALLAVGLVAGIDPSTGLGRRQSRPAGFNPLALIISTFLATLAFHVMLLTILQLVQRSGQTLDWLDVGGRVILPRIILNLVLIPFIHHPLGWLDRRTYQERLTL